MALRDGQVRHAEKEPIFALELEVAQVERAIAVLIEHRHLDRVCPRGQNLLGDEVALRIDRYLVARHPYRVPGRNAATADRDRAAAHPDVLIRERALAVGGEQLRLCVQEGRALWSGFCILRREDEPSSAVSGSPL